MRRLLAVGLTLLFLFGGVAVAVAAYDHARRDVIAPGVRVAGVPVGGLHADAARARVRAALHDPLTTPVVVRSRGRHWTLSPAQAHAAVDVDALIDQAVADSHQGDVLARTVHGVTGARLSESLPARITFSAPVVDRLVRRVGSAVARPARDATVTPHPTGLSTTDSRTGRRLAASDLRRKVTAALSKTSGTRNVKARLVKIQPKVSTKDLVKRYPAYIIIDRSAFTLRLYQGLKLWHAYPIAVGRQGLETPAGLYDIQWKQTNPSWYVPNSPWAGALAGKVIPPGPDDPIKARWMAFNGGAGIHGIDPSEYGSIGQNASHGCVRMRIPDVIQVYAHAPVHTPVFVA
jgi:lipoprotein-anchoring transpeptidase ErfK/SrfK